VILRPLPHLTDETLLLFAADELDASHRKDASVHLAGCDACSARLKTLAQTLEEFEQSQQSQDFVLTPAADARAALISQLSKLKTSQAPLRVAGSSRNEWIDWNRSAVIPGRQGYVLATLFLVATLTAAVYRREIRSGSQQISASLGLWAEPKFNLTPGATVPVTKAQLCSAASEPVAAVPVSLKSKVLAIYGVKTDRPDAYEVDYLITPELGGATDVRNLWPEPYSETAWNAHVKDQLEDRLHQLVCHGDVDLATAQHDISQDWIAAYRKYFHTDKPLAEDSIHRL
jgi:hypothetical protein